MLPREQRNWESVKVGVHLQPFPVLLLFQKRGTEPGKVSPQELNKSSAMLSVMALASFCH